MERMKDSLNEIDKAIDETLSNCDLENIRPDEVLNTVNSKVKIPKAPKKVSHKWYDDSCYSSSYDFIDLLIFLVVDLLGIVFICIFLMMTLKCQCGAPDVVHYFGIAILLVIITVPVAWAINLILLLVVKQLRGED